VTFTPDAVGTGRKVLERPRPVNLTEVICRIVTRDSI
jgi:hypothetical protein